MHVRQAIPPPLMLAGQALMIDTQEMQHGGVEVVNLDAVLDEVVDREFNCSDYHRHMVSTFCRR